MSYALWNAAPLAALADPSAALAAVTLDALDGDSLAGLGAMLNAAAEAPGYMTEQGRRRVCTCKARVRDAIARRGGIEAPTRSLAAIAANPIARRAKALSAAGDSFTAAALDGGSFNTAAGVGAWNTGDGGNPSAEAAEAAAEGLGSWLSSVWQRATGTPLSTVAGPILGAVGTMIGGPVVGALAAGLASAGSRRHGTAATPTIAAPAAGPAPAPMPADQAAARRAQLTSALAQTTGTPGPYLPTSTIDQAPRQGMTDETKKVLLYGGLAVAALFVLTRHK